MSWSVGTVYTKPWFWKKVSEVAIDSELGCANWVVMGVLTVSPHIYLIFKKNI